MPRPNWRWRKPNWHWPRQNGNAPRSKSRAGPFRLPSSTWQNTLTRSPRYRLPSPKRLGRKQGCPKTGRDQSRLHPHPSPVKGVIIDRRVNVGQTVVSNLNASSLFLIAKDLKNLQVWASVNEADIGRIRKGMKARFKVDAYPDETFDGEVAQIRLNATMTQNVVTYTVVLTTENKEMKLLPYMTASLVSKSNATRMP